MGSDSENRSGSPQERPPESSAEVRARSRLHALKEILKFAKHRQAVCEAERDRYRREKPDEPYWANSEQCAAHEARHIAEYVAEQMRQTDAAARLFLRSDGALPRQDGPDQPSRDHQIQTNQGGENDHG